MSDRASPLGAEFKPGQFGNLANGVGVMLSEPQYGFLGELAAFHASMGTVAKLAGAAADSPGAIAFAIAANRWFLAGQEGMLATVRAKLVPADGSLTDLSHGRTCMRISGPKAEWVLSKLYAIDFSQAAFSAGTGLSTTHHSIFTQIYRHDEETFDLFVFRSLARSFWHTLRRAAEETGYEVV
jgi:methylglutamate dehydrogenase subunit D